MEHLPLFLRLHGKPCLVIGGGSLGLRKTRLLLEAGASVFVNSRTFDTDLTQLADDGRISLIQGDYDSELLSGGYWLVVAATSNDELNDRISKDADAANLLCNVVDDGPRSTAIVPAIVDRSPLTVAISSGGRSPVLVRQIKARLEHQLSSRLGALTELLGRWRGRVAAALPEIGRRREFWESVIGADTLNGVLMDPRADHDQAMQQRLEAFQARRPGPGMAYLVGAGPGDPELITVKAQRLLASADVVLYDRLIEPSLLSRARRDAEFIDVGKRPGGLSVSQERINALLIKHVRAGAQVVRLKGGDPFVFGRGGEELRALLAEGLPVEVVPGITAAQGCAAAVGIPLTDRGVSQTLTLVTAHGASNGGAPALNWEALARGSQTLVFYMGVARLEEISRTLIERGLPPDTPSAVVERGTTSEQKARFTTLQGLLELSDDVRSPALVFVGQTAGLTQAVRDAA